MPNVTLSLLICSSVVSCAAAQSSTPGSNWDHLKSLSAGTMVHVHGDKLSRTCSIDRITDEELTCSKGRMVNTAHYVFARAEVESVKLTRYPLSTVTGFGIGAGAGAGISAAAFHKDSFKAVGIAVFTVGAAVAGALITGPSDTFRGPTVYRRRP